jgi:hypothetical protein
LNRPSVTSGKISLRDAAASKRKCLLNDSVTSFSATQVFVSVDAIHPRGRVAACVKHTQDDHKVSDLTKKNRIRESLDDCLPNVVANNREYPRIDEHSPYGSFDFLLEATPDSLRAVFIPSNRIENVRISGRKE